MVSGAATSTTVDWTGWLDKSAEEQRETWSQYRTLVRQESDAARGENYRRLNEALWGRRR
jgi:hypothetical protein